MFCYIQKIQNQHLTLTVNFLQIVLASYNISQTSGEELYYFWTISIDLNVTARLYNNNKLNYFATYILLCLGKNTFNYISTVIKLKGTARGETKTKHVLRLFQVTIYWDNSDVKISGRVVYKVFPHIFTVTPPETNDGICLTDFSDKHLTLTESLVVLR